MTEKDLAPVILPAFKATPPPPLHSEGYQDFSMLLFLGLALALFVTGAVIANVATEERFDMKFLTRTLGRHLIAAGAFLPLSVLIGQIEIRPNAYNFSHAFEFKAPLMALIGLYAILYFSVTLADAGIQLLRQPK